jgi:hypothetical protein
VQLPAVKPIKAAFFLTTQDVKNPMLANHHDHCRRCGVADVLGLPDPARAVRET